MYFIPDDELKQGDYNYLFSSYLNYNSSTQPLDQVFNLEYLGESDILKSVGSFNEFGVSSETGRAYTAVVTEAELSGHRSDFNTYEDRDKDPAAFGAPRQVKIGLTLEF